MRQRRVWRYYCEFCNKGGLVKRYIAKHEVSCTANPDRVCRLHQYVLMPTTQVPIKNLIACFASNKPDYGMAELRILADACPACILAAIRQSRILKYDDPENPPPDLKFDFKAELAALWKDSNEARAEASDYKNGY